jgi:hypothetical protein
MGSGASSQKNSQIPTGSEKKYFEGEGGEVGEAKTSGDGAAKISSSGRQASGQLSGTSLLKSAISSFSPDAETSKKVKGIFKNSNSGRIAWSELRKKMQLSEKHSMSKADVMKLGKEGLIVQQWSGMMSTSKKMQRLRHFSTLRTIEAPKEAIATHPAAWLWKDFEWSLGMDEFGNTYYYNTTTGESTWDPPASLAQYQLPTSELSFVVIVPDDAVPGQPFVYNIYGSDVEVMCPLDCVPGSKLELYCPTNEVEYDYADTQAEVVEEVAVDALLDLQPEQEPFDPTQVWATLASQSDLSAVLFEEYSQTSKSVLQQVSNGSYVPKLLLELPWAYKFTLFEGAIVACLKSKGSLNDSSDYDNCDGTPRYAESGFIEWANDIHKQRVQLVEKMENLFLDVSVDSDSLYKQSVSDYERMNLLANAGDDRNLLAALLERKNKVESDLQNFQSR